MADDRGPRRAKDEAQEKIEPSGFSLPLCRMELHWLRALRPLPKAARRLTLAFLPPAPVLVPAEEASLEAAVAAGARAVVLAPGSYSLPTGLVLRGPVELLGDGCVELLLGAPITISSDEGAALRNLQIRPDEAVVLPALVRVLSSHRRPLTVATAPGALWTSNVEDGSAVPAVVLERCRLFGGRHGIDARGGCGLRARAGRAAKERLAARGGGGLATRGTCVRLLACEVAGAVEEAVHAWRGAHLEVRSSWVHHCGQGITVSAPGPAGVSELGPVKLLLSETCFEHILSHTWSSAVALGRPAGPSRGDEPDQRGAEDAKSVDGGATNSHDAGPITATICHNTVRLCSLGVIASDVQLQAHKNIFSQLSLGGWQLRGVKAELQDNTSDGCGDIGPAMAVSSSEDGCTWVRLLRNIHRGCGVGLRVSSQGRSPCHIEAREEIWGSNGDGCVLIGVGCRASFANCEVQGSRRCGVRVGRGARARLEGCRIVGNGRGVAVAAAGAADVSGCTFEENVGWAVRLEGASENAVPDHGIDGSAQSTVSGNIFGAAAPSGNVGRKRLRIDAWHEDCAAVEGNVEAEGGAVVVALRKRLRGPEDEAAERLAELTLG
mmetsp:Transcript_110434/g.235898  ORF Transcript_110434/g.235898 Transcript_110434/m.235898 type:complete len:608 (+) Transcript_110434:58-1881(+)